MPLVPNSSRGTPKCTPSRVEWQHTKVFLAFCTQDGAIKTKSHFWQRETFCLTALWEESCTQLNILNINLLHYIFLHIGWLNYYNKYYCSYVDTKFIAFTVVNEWFVVKLDSGGTCKRVANRLIKLFLKMSLFTYLEASLGAFNL